MRVRKKPVEVDAWKLDSNAVRYEPMDPSVPSWVWDSIKTGKLIWSNYYRNWTIWSLEGPVEGNDGDYLIRGIIGEIYPCRGDIFWDTYEVRK